VTGPPRERFFENLDSFMLKCMTNTLSTGHSSSFRLPVLRIFKLIGTAVAVVTGASFDRIVKRHSDFESLLAHRVRLAFEHLGPTFVKAGQLLSSSAGPLPQAWMDEMAHCRDDVAAAPWKAACELLAGELGNKMDRILDMDHEPIAAGSMAQVYGARLANGDAVVVKVQRPGLERVLSKDIRILRTAARLAIRFSPSCAAANPKALVEEFASGLVQQLSFWREADNADAMRGPLSTLGVRVPKVYRDLSTDRVLVMERFAGTRPDDTNAIDGEGIDRSKLVQTIVGALLVPALGSGLFHGDMHPGNMVVLPDGDLGMLDFGVIEELESQARVAAGELLEALSARRYGDMVMALFKLIDPSQIDLNALIPEVQALVCDFIDRPLGTMDVRDAINGMLELAARNKFSLPESLVAFMKQILYISGICRILEPEFDVLGDIAPIVALARQPHPVAA
jgi:ubiquinone biosynthesis protein